MYLVLLILFIMAASLIFKERSKVESGMVTKLRTSEKVGSGSSGEQALKVDRSQVAKGLVDTVPVVEQKVL